ncbi:MAG: P-loop NTPase fold protein, partial [Rhizobiaceae bacterium]
MLGKWGTGKSTVKGLYLDGLRNDEKKSGEGAKRRDRIYPVTFNAWKYAGESEIRKSLFRHIFLQIGGTNDEADRNLFKTVASTEYRKKSFNEIWAEFLDQYAVGLAVVGLFVLLFVIIVVLLIWMASAFGVHNTFTSLGSLVTSGGVVSWLAQKFFSNLPVLSARTPVLVLPSPTAGAAPPAHDPPPPPRPPPPPTPPPPGGAPV